MSSSLEIALKKEIGKEQRKIQQREKLKKEQEGLLTRPWRPLIDFFPLHALCHKGNVDKVDKYLQNIPDSVNEFDFQRKTPLMVAVKHGHLEIVWLLVKKYRAECNVHDIDGFTPLHYAAETRQVGILKFLLQVPSIEVDIIDNKNRTPLMTAIISGVFGSVEALLNAGADIHHEDWNKDTPFSIGCRLGLLSVVKLIYDLGANPDQTDRCNRVPLHHAATGGQYEIIKFLIPHINHSINILDDYGNTPLHYACSFSSVVAVKILLKAKADVTIKNKNHFLPYQMLPEFSSFSPQIKRMLDNNLQARREKFYSTAASKVKAKFYFKHSDKRPGAFPGLDITCKHIYDAEEKAMKEVMANMGIKDWNTPARTQTTNSSLSAQYSNNSDGSIAASGHPTLEDEDKIAHQQPYRGNRRQHTRINRKMPIARHAALIYPLNILHGLDYAGMCDPAKINNPLKKR